MASHLTITPSSSAGISSSKGGKAQGSTGADADGAFAALLGATSQQASTTASTETTTEPGLGNLVDLSGFGSEEGEGAEDPNAIAVAIDAVLPIQTAMETNPALTDLVDSLGELKLSLESGETVDPELLQRIDGALSDLAAELDIDPATLPSLGDLKTLTAAILPDDTSAAAQLTAALAPLAETLLTDTTEISADAEFSAQVKSIGEKLAALLQSINSDDADADKLAALGVAADTAIDADLEAALAKLTNPAVKVETSATAQALAAPSLKLTEPALTGKAVADATASAEPTSETGDKSDVTVKVAAVSGDEASLDDNSADSHDRERKPADTAPAVATAIAGAAEAPTESQVTVLPTHVASRIDAAAARPVVQPGYQTSQQQLNLPQLAFELVRQVGDGNTRFQLRLDPAELGKIDVQLDIDSTGQVNARLTVERAETLDLMQRDQRGLEKALQQAGLDSTKTNLEFSLKQNSSGGQQGQDGSGRQSLFGTEVKAEAEETPLPTINLYRGSLRASGVNIIA